MLSLHNLFLVNLWQAIHIVVVALNAEVLGQIDYLYILRNGVLLQESFALAVTKAEEDDIHLVEGHLGSKALLGFAEQAFMHVTNQIACVALAVGKDNLCLGVVQQHTDEFTARISCRT